MSEDNIHETQPQREQIHPQYVDEQLYPLQNGFGHYCRFGDTGRSLSLNSDKGIRIPGAFFTEVNWIIFSPLRILVHGTYGHKEEEHDQVLAFQHLVNTHSASSVPR
ncbi:hypothetical protein [Paenibacillus sp. BK033]|uniref:hypothetical protein n=1 Tax=Paenibacillus sp. BK033 TaxID=2512133 RepID=UPI00104A3B0B|nr:hypothetical protein [Paenibacillus sp. BK033]